MARLPLLLVCLALLLVGCPQPATNTDAAADRADKPAPDALEAPDLVVFDAPLRDRPDVPSIDAPDVIDRPDASDSPDARPIVDIEIDLPDTAPPLCVPGTSFPCRCLNGIAGTRTCHPSRAMGLCTCIRPPPDGGMAAPLPPRLVFPLSDTRVTSQRPTLRWALPDGVPRARVELCADRACTRSLVREEVSGSSWRSATPLAPGVKFWHVQGLSAAGAVVWSSATWEFQVKHRDTPVDSATGPIHDFNGDGYDDLAAGAGTGFTGPQLYVFLGSASGLPMPPSAVLTAPGRSDPRQSEGFLGDTAIGDPNGDGVADLATTEFNYGYQALLDGGADRRVGMVWLFHGGEGGLSADRVQRHRWELAGQFGNDVAFVDFNGDGYDDLLVTGASSVEASEVFLFAGSAAGVGSVPVSYIPGIMARSIGSPLSEIFGLGDVDGDGYGDFALGRYGHIDEPGVMILHGNPGARLDARIEEFSTTLELYNLGLAFGAGDFNGDGLADAFAACYGPLGALRGSPLGMEVAANLVPYHGYPDISGGAGGFLGWSLGRQGDLNGDGYDDLVAAGNCDPIFARTGTLTATCAHGETFVYAGSLDGVPAVPVLFLPRSGSGRDSSFNYPISPGDVNGDGIDDLTIGVAGGVNGAINVYFGGALDWIAPSQVVRAAEPVLLGRGLY